VSFLGFELVRVPRNRGKPPRDTNGLVRGIKSNQELPTTPHLERPAPEDHAATYCLPEMSSTNVEKPTEPEGVQITTGTQCPKFFPSQNSAGVRRERICGVPLNYGSQPEFARAIYPRASHHASPNAHRRQRQGRLRD
jgi:hypothetical protein